MTEPKEPTYLTMEIKGSYGRLTIPKITDYKVDNDGFIYIRCLNDDPWLEKGYSRIVKEWYYMRITEVIYN